MNCKEMRELIMTDYQDGELAASVKAAVEAHIAGCPGCKNFYKVSVKAGDELFHNARRATPPEYVWRRIRDTIIAEDAIRRPSVGGWRLKDFFPAFKPAYALATALMFLAILGAVIGTRVGMERSQNSAKVESMQYFTYVGGAVTAASVNGETGFGTAIEESFL